MILEQKLLLKIMADFINNRPFVFNDEYKNANWHLLLKEANWQSVLLLVMETIASEQNLLDKNEFSSEYNLTFAHSIHNASVDYSQKELVTLLQTNGYEYIILKGAAAACYYPKPELRAFGDVDFLVKDEDKLKIKELLLSNGYKSVIEEHICHMVFKKPKANLEMHFEISGIPEGSIGEKVREYVKPALATRKTIKANNYSFYVAEEKINGLIILLHLQHHMLSEGIGLRHLCDWASFVIKNCNQPFFEKDLLPFIKSIGLFTFVSAITKTAAIYFEFPVPDFAKGIDRSICEEIIEDVFSGGNFGRKDFAHKNSGMMVSQHGKKGAKHGKAYNAFMALKSSVEHWHPSVKKHKSLYLIFMPFRAVKYLISTITGKRASFLKTMPVATKRLNLYRKLKIFEEE